MHEPALTSGQRLRRQGETSSGLEASNKDAIANLIVIGASAGGHHALAEILKELSADMPAAIVVVLHMPLGGFAGFERTLGRFSRLPIKEFDSQERVRQGCIFVPPPGKSAEFTNGMIRVEPEVPRNPVITINHLFISAAQNYGDRVIGVILTGMLRDGTKGLRAVHEAGGLTMVQDPQEAEYGDMPANAMHGLPVTFCLKLTEIGAALELLVRRSTQFETGLTIALRTLRDRAALLVRLAEQSGHNPGTHTYLMNELIALRRDIRSIDDVVANERGVR